MFKWWSYWFEGRRSNCPLKSVSSWFFWEPALWISNYNIKWWNIVQKNITSQSECVRTLFMTNNPFNSKYYFCCLKLFIILSSKYYTNDLFLMFYYFLQVCCYGILLGHEQWRTSNIFSVTSLSAGILFPVNQVHMKINRILFIFNLSFYIIWL